MSELYSATRRLLKARPRSLTYEDIAQSTELSRDFVKRVALDRLKVPNVHQVERLYVFLSGRKLEL